MKYAESALSVLQREIQRNDDPAARDRALDALTEASRSTTDMMNAAQRHRETLKGFTRRSISTSDVIVGGPAARGAMTFDFTPSLANVSFLNLGRAAFLSNLVTFRGPTFGSSIVNILGEPIVPGSYDASLVVQDLSQLYDAPTLQWVPYDQLSGSASAVPQFGGKMLELPTLRPATKVNDEQETYWRGVRDSLQRCFSVSLERLATLIGIAYPTLVSLGRRRPHPSTTRSVLRLHALTTDYERAKGHDAAVAWFASEGLEILQARGFDELKRTVIREIYGRQRARGGISLREEPNAFAASDLGDRH
jgi:hypothetical protein